MNVFGKTQVSSAVALALGPVAGVLLSTMIASPSLAQESQAATAEKTESANLLDEVVVTAQRRTERLQDVPISMSAIGPEVLETRQITDITGLQGVVPSLAISTFAGVNATNIVSLRGISGQPLPIGAGQATAVYIDGVYLPRPDSGFFALDDIDRIEVLLGPQGTLYGRNATAGAINILTHQPGQQLGGGLDVSYGSYNSIKARGSLGGPLSDRVSASVSGAYDSHDGYFKNTVDGARLGDMDSYTLRGKLRYYNPDSSLDITVAADFSKFDGGEPTKSLVAPPTYTNYVGIGDPDVVTTDIPDALKLLVDSKGGSAVINYDVTDALTLTSVTGYRDTDTDTAYDGDASARPLFLTGSVNSSKSFNQEVRGVYTGARLRATFGANYFHEKASFGLNVGSPAVPVNLNSPYDTSNLDAWAIFGQFELDLTDKLTAVAGFRYNDEQRDFTIDYRNGSVPGNYITGTVSDNATLPAFGLNYKPSEDILLYAKASEGYQAPGFNFAPGPFATANTFGPENLWAYEVGAKTQFLERRVTLNLAAFYYDYKDIQVRSVLGPGVTIVNNAAAATAKGMEASATVLIVDGLTLSMHGTYLDARYDSFCDVISAGTPQADDPLCSANLADRSGNWLNQAPKWSGGASVNYSRPLTTGTTLNANVSYSGQSGVFFTSANEVPASNKGWDKVDATLGVAFENGLEVYAYGLNLTDDRYVGQIYRLSPVVLFGSINAPLTYGVGIRYHF